MSVALNCRWFDGCSRTLQVFKRDLGLLESSLRLALEETTHQPLLCNERSNDTFAAEPVKYQSTKPQKTREPT